MINERKCAADILFKIEKNGAYSNITLSDYYKDKELTEKNKAFISALVYGVLDRKITIDYVLSRYMKNPVSKTSLYTLCVMREALYQIMYMDKVPESAAVNEAVKLINKSGERRNAGFVNAVLRAVLKNGAVLPDGTKAEDLSVKYSCPLYMVESFLKDYGYEDTVGILKESLKPAVLTVKVNTIKTDSEALKSRLEAKGIAVTENGMKNSFNLSKGIDFSTDTDFLNGLFYAEDAACQKAVEALGLKKGDRVLDMCAAPGGKSFSAALCMENKGEIISCDLYEKRAELIKKSAEKLGIGIIKTAVCDATRYYGELGQFDAVICDVPCSGFGVIRRKPDIKYKEITDFESLENTQYEILKNAVKYLKNGGKILYSTCTLRRSENDGLVFRFQKEYNIFSKVTEKTLLPHIDKTDGFYYAVLKKEESFL